MEIKIKIEGLEQLTESLALIGSAMAFKNNMVPTAKEAVELMDKATKTEPKEEPKEEIKKEEPKKEEVKSKFTREDVRAAFVGKNSPSTREKLKALLDKYDTANISELEEKHFEDVMKDLEAI